MSLTSQKKNMKRWTENHESKETKIQLTISPQEIQENESVEERICEESPSVSKQKPQNHLHQIELPITHSTLSTENRNVNDNEDELNLECAADLDKISQEKILETSFCITSEQVNVTAMYK